MRTLLFALALLLPFAPAAQEPATPAARQEKMKTIVERGNRELSERLVAGDVEGVAAVYAEDAVMYGPDGLAVHGRDKILQYFRPLTEVKSWKLEVLSVGGGAGTIWQTGRSTLVYTSKEGERTSVVEYCGVWRQSKDETWHLAVDSYWPVETAR